MRQRWRETQAAFERGWYEYAGRRVDMADDLERMRSGTRLHLPTDIPGLTWPEPTGTTRFEVTGESTLQAVERLAGSPELAEEGSLAALNFASARNPGGGVANGARAQEESLARSSALYDALVQCREFYEHHRHNRSLLYSDRVIHAPHVPVFRRDDGSWLATPVHVAFLTSAAPNRRMLERNSSAEVAQVPEALEARARAVLAVAAHHEHSHLVLGAWGCGVFGNDPAEVAAAFAVHLRGTFAGVFRRVVFAVLDRHGATRDAFVREFGDDTTAP